MDDDDDDDDSTPVAPDSSRTFSTCKLTRMTATRRYASSVGRELKKVVRREAKGREGNKPSVSAGDETDCRTETEGKTSFLYFEMPYLSARAARDLTTPSNLCSAVAAVAIPSLYILLD